MRIPRTPPSVGSGRSQRRRRRPPLPLPASIPEPSVNTSDLAPAFQCSFAVSAIGSSVDERSRPGVPPPLLSLFRIVQPAARMKPHIVVTRMRPVLFACVVETLPDSVVMVDQTRGSGPPCPTDPPRRLPRPFTADGAAANWQVVSGTSRGPRPLKCCHERSTRLFPSYNKT